MEDISKLAPIMASIQLKCGLKADLSASLLYPSIYMKQNQIKPTLSMALAMFKFRAIIAVNQTKLKRYNTSRDEDELIEENKSSLKHANCYNLVRLEFNFMKLYNMYSRSKNENSKISNTEFNKLISEFEELIEKLSTEVDNIYVAKIRNFLLIIKIKALKSLHIKKIDLQYLKMNIDKYRHNKRINLIGSYLYSKIRYQE